MDTSIENWFIRAIGTLLGADIGIGMSYILAILASNEIKHLPIKALFTTGEENGLLGAAQLKKDWLTGTTLINLDGKDKGVLVTGSVGAINHTWEIIADRENVINSGWVPYTINVDGLKGDHSGLEIDSGRANATKVITRALYSISDSIPLLLESIDGGERGNVILSICEAKIFIKKEHKEYNIKNI